LVRRANHTLRYVILLIADNLLGCNGYFRGLAERWWAAGIDPRIQRVRAAKRFCRIAYQMVAGRQVFRHPSCQQRHKILEKLCIFYTDHITSLDQISRDLRAAADWIPPAEYAAEAEPFLATRPSATQDAAPSAAEPTLRPSAQSPSSSRRRRGPRPLSQILPAVLLRLGVHMVQSNPKGETDPA
jgi:hypothetical protein